MLSALELLIIIITTHHYKKSAEILYNLFLDQVFELEHILHILLFLLKQVTQG